MGFGGQREAMVGQDHPRLYHRAAIALGLIRPFAQIVMSYRMVSQRKPPSPLQETDLCVPVGRYQ